MQYKAILCEGLESWKMSLLYIQTNTNKKNAEYNWLQIHVLLYFRCHGRLIMKNNYVTV